MKLVVGILRGEPGWTILLEQIGIDWKVLTDVEDLSPETASVVIVNTVPTSFQQKGLQEFLDGGGALLTTSDHARYFVAGRYKRRWYGSLPPSALGIHSPSGMLDIYAHGVGESGTGDQRIPGIHRVGKGFIASLPFDVSGLCIDRRSRRKNFYFDNGRLPGEVTATVSKSELRRLVCEVLRLLHQRRGIPFIHKWYYPDGKSSIFTFRVDSDQGTQHDVDALYELCARHSVKTMWFVDTKSHESWLSRFREFGSQEVGVHCYDHMSYEEDEPNLQNLGKAYSLLTKNGIDPKGAAAPYGTWNPSIAGVFERLGFSYSSEFSLDYDNLPFHPFLDGRFTSVLQLPIHPICVGSMLRSGYSPAEMVRYFKRLVDEKISLREPICLYHHPTHHRLDVFESVFDYVRLRGVQNFSYGEYASWWQLRAKARRVFEFNAAVNTIVATARQDSPNLLWHIVLPGGEESITDLSGVVSLDSLELSVPAQAPPPPRDIRRIRRFDFRHPIMNILDAWYKKTQ
ncbi:MAG TPA: polysaccharide deacetylase family protein [Bacteroidota bacterium]|nr:polysaccharide deacetylase family protein [Bacteroidota bacterium]